MLNHREKHKKNDKPCNICGKLIKNFASFKAHIRAHGQERAHSCKICGKSFKRNFDLTIHMRIHTGDKPYPCDLCEKSFSLSSTLSKHKKYHQTVPTNTDVLPQVLEKAISPLDFKTYSNLFTSSSSIIKILSDLELIHEKLTIRNN